MSTRICRNCSSTLIGPYCASCGQREDRPDLHIWEAIGELFGEVFTLDSRLWRTLMSLLFRPGFLTAEYLAGRRARYLPPFRLYLAISFLLFLVLSLAPALVEVEDLDFDLDSGPAALEEAMDPNTAVTANRVLEQVDDSWLQRLRDRVERNRTLVAEEPEEYLAKIGDYMPQMMFLMLPLFAGLMKLMFLFSRFHYLQHLIFAIHLHSFVYLLFLIAELVDQFSVTRFTPIIDSVFLIMLLLYLPLALRRCYAIGFLGIITRSIGIVSIYSFLLIIGLAAAAITVLAAM